MLIRNSIQYTGGSGPPVQIPVFLSDDEISFPEGAAYVHTLVTDIPCTFAITGGADSAQGSIAGDELTIDPQVYPDTLGIEITATADLGGGTAVQNIVGTVTQSNTLTTTFGAKTRVGWEGYALSQYFTGTPVITAGNAAGHFQIDDTKCLTPRNGAAAYGTAPPAWSGPYSLTISDGTTTKTVNISIVTGVLGIAAKNSGANSSDMQLTDAFYSPYNYLVLGDIVRMRPGIYNPNHTNQVIGPRATYTGSGRIKLTSEIPYTAIIRRIKFDGNVSGNISWPIDIEDVLFQVGPTAPSEFVICDQSGEGGGHRLRRCRFEVDAAHPTPAIFNALTLGRDGYAVECVFKNTGQAIKLQNYPTGNVITDNDFNGIWGDGCSGHFRSISYERNLTFNKVFLTGSGAHTDGLQHLGILEQVQIGTGDGVTKTFPVTLPGAPIQLSAAVKLGANGSPFTCQIIAGKFTGSGMVSASSVFDVVTGTGQITFTFTPGAGVPIYMDFASTTGGTEWDFGTVADNYCVRNVGTTGQVDAQSYFFDDTYGLSRFTNAVFRNNVGQQTFGNGLFMKFFKDPVIEFNTLIKDIAADAGGTAASQTSILVLGGSGGTLNRNLSNAYNLTGHTGLTLTPNPNVSVPATAPGYAAAFNAWAATGLTTRAAVRAALAPKPNGTAKNADNTYNGAFLPDGTNNTGAVYP